MSSISLIDLKVNNAEQFLEAVSEPVSDNVYLSFGKVDAWANDALPNVANVSLANVIDVWKNMIGLKKITGNDIQHVIPRYTWAANTVYHEFDQHDVQLFGTNNRFYIITSDYNVYKCIFNKYEANSTIEPTSINPNTVTATADGYIWKYMFTVSDSELLRFTTDDFIPVKKLTIDDSSTQWQVQNNAIDGTIFAVRITNPGSGYTNVANLSLVISGDGAGANGTVGINNISNTVNSITLTSYGTGYRRATISILGGGGTGATAKALLSPLGGHGSNPVYELGGSRLLLNPRIRNTEDGILSVDNEFRQIAIIKNPLKATDGLRASNSAISQTMDLTVAGGGVDYVEDEIVYIGANVAAATFSARILSFNSANNLLRVINPVGTPTNDNLVGDTSTASKFISSVSDPEIEAYSGNILYIDHIVPIIRDNDQTEDFKIILSF